MANAFVETCKATYAELKAIQDAKVEEWAIGYESDEELYYSEIEPRVTFKSVMVAVAREWRARKAEARAEAEYWEAREREHFAHLSDPAVAESDPATAVFRTRNGALAAALLAVRAIARGVRLVVAAGGKLTSHRYGVKVMNMSNTDTITRNCGKCAGTGRIQAFAGIDSGRCWDCNGAGAHTTTVGAEKRRKAAAKRRASKRMAAADQRIADEMRAFAAAGFTLREWHEDRCGCGGFCAREWNDGAMGKAWDAALGG
ncbi:hypothetical protein KDJ61_gp06 [Gordonia phage TZGordon]|uniref:Uncharacterized protein n=1 Tax=Gordonia phage TZGordon TaxID=2744004 RepID=A0A6N0A8F4_9CAUD|nr:hypothetical protein KDJ61_gp06 [Gordonia phage TZGordon]QKO02927.1 hypothetical protein SEA_TZGORDON_6 [Gordonia phage TZGordon]